MIRCHGASSAETLPANLQRFQGAHARLNPLWTRCNTSSITAGRLQIDRPLISPIHEDIGAASVISSARSVSFPNEPKLELKQPKGNHDEIKMNMRLHLLSPLLLFHILFQDKKMNETFSTWQFLLGFFNLLTSYLFWSFELSAQTIFPSHCFVCFPFRRIYRKLLGVLK